MKYCEQATQLGFVELMIYGHVDREQANAMWQTVSHPWASNPHTRDQQLRRQVALLPENGPTYLSQRARLDGTGVLLVVDQGDFTFERRAAQQLLAKALEEPLFSQLRTQQQTAYLVRGWAEETERHLYNFVAIQSANYDGRDLLARVELSIEQFLRSLGHGYTSDQFDRIRQSAITALEQPPQSPDAMADLLALYAFEYDGDFQWRDKRLAALRALTFDRWIALSQELIGRPNLRRLGILIEGPLQGTAFHYTKRAMQPFKRTITYAARPQ
jgi:secreted Zn-dependent insulinase-like peptidase